MANSNFITLPESFSEARRLRVMRKTIDFIDEGFTHGPILVDKIERWCEDNRETLQNYIEPTGLVSSSLRHKSSRNYLRVIEGAGLIKNLYGSRWILTKYGNVLSRLPKNEISLELKLHEMCFFSKHLLERDFTNLTNLVKAIKEAKHSSEITQFFKQNIMTQLSTAQKAMAGIRQQQELQKKIGKIRGWKKSRLNHVVVPRLNWMIDLKVIDWGLYEKGEIALSDEGETFFSSIPKIAKASLDEWLQNSFYRIFSQGYRNLLSSRLKLWYDLAEKYKKEIAAMCVKKGLQIIGGREVRRVSIVPLIEYFCIHLLVDEGIICSFGELHNEIEKYARSRNDLTYRWVPYDKDGYIRQIG